VKRKASDLFVGERKLSVSVATASASSSKVHLGLNITSKGVPDGVKAIGLAELGINDALTLAKTIATTYVQKSKMTFLKRRCFDAWFKYRRSKAKLQLRSFHRRAR
jgi:hypothetical protein